MKWRGRRGSSNIEDRRRMGGGRVGGGRGMAIGGGGLGAVAIVLIGLFLGVDLTPMLGGGNGGFAGASSQEVTAADEEAAQFVSVTLADTEQVWSQIFQEQLGQQYQPVTLVLFKGATQSGCGGASAQTGPFYCPSDAKVYLDTDFFVTLERQLGAGGDFAAAYVVAHEVGHYVQDQLGILSEAQRGQQQGADSAAVRVELQADCFAGVWANYAQNRLGTIESGDVEEAMNAAEQIGDDTLQQEAGQAVRPDSFTHGTSEQRQRWFYAGFESGDLNACDTFRAQQL
jgi:predicted metalloprotease